MRLINAHLIAYLLLLLSGLMTCSRQTCSRQTCSRQTCSRQTCSRQTCSRQTCSWSARALGSSSLYAQAADRDLLPIQPLDLPKITPSVRFQSDYELTRRLVEQTQAQLGDFELLADEYERFQDLEERLLNQSHNLQLAEALRSCALQIQEVLQRRHLREQFTPDFIKQIDRFATLSIHEDNAP